LRPRCAGLNHAGTGIVDARERGVPLLSERIRVRLIEPKGLD